MVRRECTEDKDVGTKELKLGTFGSVGSSFLSGLSLASSFDICVLLEFEITSKCRVVGRRLNGTFWIYFANITVHSVSKESLTT